MINVHLEHTWGTWWRLSFAIATDIQTMLLIGTSPSISHEHSPMGAPLVARRREAMLQRLRDPLGVADVAFAAGQSVDVRRVQWPDRHVLFDAVEVLVAWDRVRGCAQIVTDSSTRRVQ